MGKLDGKVALITGAGRGHAEAVTRKFAQEGAAVSICDVIPRKELEEGIGSKIGDGKVLCFESDVSKEAQVGQMVDKPLNTLVPLIYWLMSSVLQAPPRMCGI